LKGILQYIYANIFGQEKKPHAFRYVGFMDGNDYFGVVSGTRTIKGMKNFPRNMPPIMPLSTLAPFDSC
jgi:hypothetical protein